MPAEMPVAPGAPTTATTETLGEGLRTISDSRVEVLRTTDSRGEGPSTTEGLTQTTTDTWSKVHDSHEVSERGYNGKFDNPKFDNPQFWKLCGKCHCKYNECQCEHFVDSDSEAQSNFIYIASIIQRVPEMMPVEKTIYRKQVDYEQRTVSVRKSRIVEDEVEHTELVPVVKHVPKTRTVINYKVTMEEMEETETVLEVQYEEVVRIESRPRVITKHIEETIMVPVVKKVPKIRWVEQPTGRYREVEVEKFISMGDFNLKCNDSCHLYGSAHVHLPFKPPHDHGHIHPPHKPPRGKDILSLIPFQSSVSPKSDDSHSDDSDSDDSHSGHILNRDLPMM